MIRSKDLEIESQNSGLPPQWTAAVLIAANMVPAAGVLFWDWSGAVLFTLYWAETVIIGFYAIPKIAFAAKGSDARGAFFIIPFFCFHFGVFMFGYGQFLAHTFDVDISFLEGLKVPLIILFISHGISFLYHYVMRREYVESTQGEMMAQPYRRILPMHLGILFGGLLSARAGGDIGYLLVLILVKTGLDLRSHLAERKPGNVPGEK